MELPASSFTANNQTYEQIVISCTYTSYKDVGQFGLYAKEGAFPTDDYSTIRSKSLNAFMQILELPPPNVANASYFILLEGASATRLNITVYPIDSMLNPELQMNGTITYLASR